MKMTIQYGLFKPNFDIGSFHIYKFSYTKGNYRKVTQKLSTTLMSKRIFI
jgi:hypothetical protein